MRVWILAVAVVVVLAGVAGGAYWFGGRTADEPVLVLNTVPAASDGIKVHGDWTVTVSDPKTGEDMVYAFQNSLTKYGERILLGEFIQSFPATTKFAISFFNEAGKRACQTDFTVPVLVPHDGGWAASIDGTCTSILETQITEVTVNADHYLTISQHSKNMDDGTGNMIIVKSYKLHQHNDEQDFSSKTNLDIPIGSGQPISASVFISFN